MSESLDYLNPFIQLVSFCMLSLQIGRFDILVLKKKENQSDLLQHKLKKAAVTAKLFCFKHGACMCLCGWVGGGGVIVIFRTILY